MSTPPTYVDPAASYTDIATRALPRYGFGPGADLRLLSLSENGTFLVTEDGRRTVLRVHRPGYQDDTSIRSELAWTDRLRRVAGVSSPAVVTATDGSPVVALPTDTGLRHVVAFEFVPGATGEELETPIPPAELATISARMHADSERWAPPAGFSRFHWDVDACFGAEKRWGDWRDAPGLAAGDVPLVARAAETVVEALAAYGTAKDRYGLIHADLRLANLMVDDDTIWVIDFDDCGFGWFLYDLATTLSWFEHTEGAVAHAEEWLRAYLRHRELTPQDLAMVPTFVMMRRLMLTAWLGTHPDSPPAQELGHAYAAGTVDLARRYVQDPGWFDMSHLGAARSVKGA